MCYVPGGFEVLHACGVREVRSLVGCLLADGLGWRAHLSCALQMLGVFLVYNCILIYVIGASGQPCSLKSLFFLCGG